MVSLRALAPHALRITIGLAAIGCDLDSERPRSPRTDPDDETGGSSGATGGSGGKKGGTGGSTGTGGMMMASKDAGSSPGDRPDAVGEPARDARPPDVLAPMDLMVAPAAPKLSKDVLPILKMRCAVAGCHDPVKKEHGMDMSSVATIYPAWVNKVTADHCKNNAAVTRVVPFKPDESFVITLISAVPGRCAEVRRMPPPTLPQLPASEVKVIRDWVAAGAMND